MQFADDPELAALDALQIEQLFDQAIQPSRVSLHHRRLFGKLPGAVPELFERTQQQRQRRSELMADIGEECALFPIQAAQALGLAGNFVAGLLGPVFFVLELGRSLRDHGLQAFTLGLAAIFPEPPCAQDKSQKHCGGERMEPGTLEQPWRDVQRLRRDFSGHRRTVARPDLETVFAVRQVGVFHLSTCGGTAPVLLIPL